MRLQSAIRISRAGGPYSNRAKKDTIQMMRLGYVRSLWTAVNEVIFSWNEPKRMNQNVPFFEWMHFLRMMKSIELREKNVDIKR